MDNSLSLFQDKNGERGTTQGVEYRKKPGNVWYEAQLLNVVGDSHGGFVLHLGFADSVWTPCAVDPSCVRNSALPQGDVKLEANEKVEVWTPVTPNSPASWSPARVEKTKADFVYVIPENAKSSMIVEKSAIRSPSLEPSYTNMTDNISRHTIPVGDSIGGWATSEDAAGCFSHICLKTGLLSMGPDPNDAKQIILLGKDASIRKATMLIEIHLKHQVQIASFQSSRLKQLNQLEGLKAKVDNMHSLDLHIPQDSIPKIIGTNGANIKKIQDKYQVTIHIYDNHKVDEKGPNGEVMKCLRIMGKDKDNVEAAKTQVEYVEVSIPVPKEQYGWILGRQGKTIQQLKDKSGVGSLSLRREQETLAIYGTRPTVEDAQAMVEAHMLYYPVFSQMDEEMQQINDSLDHLNFRGNYGSKDARRSSSAKRGKGKGKSYWDEEKKKPWEKGEREQEQQKEERKGNKGRGGREQQPRPNTAGGGVGGKNKGFYRSARNPGATAGGQTSHYYQTDTSNDWGGEQTNGYYDESTNDWNSPDASSSFQAESKRRTGRGAYRRGAQQPNAAVEKSSASKEGVNGSNADIQTGQGGGRDRRSRKKAPAQAAT